MSYRITNLLNENNFFMDASGKGVHLKPKETIEHPLKLVGGYSTLKVEEIKDESVKEEKKQPVEDNKLKGGR